MKRIVTILLVVSLGLGPSTGIFAQQKFALTIDNLMRGPELYGYEPSAVRWSGDNQHIYFQWKQARDPIDHPMDTYVVGRDGSGLRKLTDEEVKLVPAAFGGSRTHDRKKVVYATDGDLFLYDYSTSAARQLTKTADAEQNPRFTQDEKQVAFTRGGNLYVMSLDTGMIEQMTEITQAAGRRGSRDNRRTRGRRWTRRPWRRRASHRDRRIRCSARNRQPGIPEEAGKRAARNRAGSRDFARGERAQAQAGSSAQAVPASGAPECQSPRSVPRWKMRHRYGE